MMSGGSGIGLPGPNSYGSTCGPMGCNGGGNSGMMGSNIMGQGMMRPSSTLGAPGGSGFYMGGFNGGGPPMMGKAAMGGGMGNGMWNGPMGANMGGGGGDDGDMGDGNGMGNGGGGDGPPTGAVSKSSFFKLKLN